MSALDDFLEKHPQIDRMLDALGGTTEEDLGMDTVLLRLLVACVIGWLIGRVYRRTFTGRRESPTLPDTHMLLCLGGALIWLVVADNIVRAFGLAGTIGLIRYRTVVRDPKDTTILLFSMVMGMACGLGQFSVALVGTVVVLMTMVYLHYNHRRMTQARERESQDLISMLDDRPEGGGKPPSDTMGQS